MQTQKYSEGVFFKKVVVQIKQLKVFSFQALQRGEHDTKWEGNSYVKAGEGTLGSGISQATFS